MILTKEKLVKNLVCKVAAKIERPTGWNHDGEMDEYVDKHVRIEMVEDTVVCVPLFKPKYGSYWVWGVKDFTKANTIQTIPRWVIK